MADGEYERVLDAIEAHELVALLSGLSERERMILEDRSPSETAQRLGVSTERVRKIARPARAKLAAAARDDAGKSTRRV